ncbi:MAG: alpha/beta fold hydrolase [Acidobacteria bacterium]|nr:alpha/beta fold hydrolase [Acidobacteriota bacterium]
MKFSQLSQLVVVCLCVLGAPCVVAQAPLPTPTGERVVLGNASVQADRYELGQRQRAAEAAWDAQPQPEKRLDAIVHLNRAVKALFSLNLAEAGRSLDEARFTLSEPLTPFALWAESACFVPSTRLLDAAEAELAFAVRTLYEAKSGIQPRDARLKITVLRDGKATGKAQEFPLPTLPINSTLSLKGLGEGDYTLRLEFKLNTQTLTVSEQTLSLINRPAARITQLQQLANLSKTPTTDSETARALGAMLFLMWQRQLPETNLPFARLLAEAELAANLSRINSVHGGAYYGLRRPGQYWLTLATASGAVATRVQAPESVKASQPLPLVIALHGAGGSENSVFDGYGRGAMAELCAQRGWLLVAPRGTMGFTPLRTAEIIDAVDKLYPVDRYRVFLVGHSLGATQAIASVQAAPLRYAGVAALGSGGSVIGGIGVENMSFFIGVGTEDFIAYQNARKLAYDLKRANVKTVRLREYREIEHLMIVPTALPDVFAYFDDLAARVPALR